LVKKLIPINRLGDALRAARQAAKTTQQQLADDADIPRLAVIRAEAGTGLLRPFESLLVPLKCEIQGRNLPRGTDIGTRFKELRIARGISQAKIAEAAGLSRPTIAAIESGEPGHLAAVEALGLTLGAGLTVRPIGAPASFWTSIAATSLDERWTTPLPLLERLYRAIGGGFLVDAASPRKDGPFAPRLGSRRRMTACRYPGRREVSHF
jgi:transcriptional regulator with XRE-family HTH domain